MKVGFEPGTKPVPRPDEQLQYDTQTTTTTQVYNILSLRTIVVQYTIKQQHRYIISNLYVHLQYNTQTLSTQVMNIPSPDVQLQYKTQTISTHV